MVNGDPVVPLAAVDLWGRPVRGAGHSVELVGEVELRGLRGTPARPCSTALAQQPAVQARLTRASPEKPFARRTFAASNQAEGTSGKGSSSGTAQEEAAASGEERPGGPQEDDPREEAKGAEPALCTGSGLRVLGSGVEPTPDSEGGASGLGFTGGAGARLLVTEMLRPWKEKEICVMSDSPSLPIQSEATARSGRGGPREGLWRRRAQSQRPKEAEDQASSEKSAHKEGEEKKGTVRLHAVHRTPVTPQITLRPFQKKPHPLKARGSHPSRKDFTRKISALVSKVQGIYLKL